ncbi:MAG: PAS domain S-box protein [Azospirillaceae bacterium]|nr:PAS domain S-box protein [Azospirillaceae bacterium]
MLDLSFSDAQFSDLLQTYVAATTDTVIILDARHFESSGEATIVYVNQSVTRLSGYTDEELIGRPMSFLLPPERHADLRRDLEQAARAKGPLESEIQAIRKDGKHHWLQVSTTAALLPTGRLSHFIRMGRDITARKRAELERETTQRLLASIFGAIDQALGVIDTASNFVMINTALTRQFGWSVFDLIGKPFTAVLEPSRRDAISRALKARAELEQTTRLEARLRHRNGSASDGELVVTTIPQPDGKQYRVMMILQRPTDAPPNRGTVDPSFQQAVRKALQGGDRHGSVVAGKLQLVGLAAVREASGERWAAIAERTFAAAEQILRRHLDPGDVFSRTTDDGFLVCFAQLSESEAHFKAQAIGNEIRERLIGEHPEMAATQVVSFAAEIEIDADEAADEDSFVALLESRLATTRKRIEETAITAMRTCLATARVTFRPLRTDSNHVAPLSYVRLPSDLDEQLNKLLALGRTEFVPDTELLLLTGATERIFDEVKYNKSDLVLLPVRMATLTTRRQAENWLQVARNVGEPGKKRMVVEIRDLGRNTARSRMIDVAILVSPLFRAVAFELPSMDPAFVASLPISTPMVTIQAKLLSESTPLHTARLLKALALQRCRLIVKNVTSPAQAAMFVKAGIALVATTYDERENT